MAVSSIIVKYVFVKIVKSKYRHQLYLLFNIEESTKPLTHIHSCWTREKREILLLRFGFIGEERNVFWIILSKRRIFWQQSSFCATIIISWRQDHSLEHPVLKTSWLASKVRSSARRRRRERKQREEQYRTFLTSLRCQDLPSCSCGSRSIQHSFNIFCLRQNWTWRTRYEEIVPYLSFLQSSASSASQRNRIRQRN